MFQSFSWFQSLGPALHVAARPGVVAQPLQLPWCKTGNSVGSRGVRSRISTILASSLGCQPSRSQEGMIGSTWGECKFPKP